jgi:aminoglycoside 3-N-acetyltransferase
MMQKKILEISPWFEVIIKTLYWRFNWINALLVKRARAANKSNTKTQAKPKTYSFELITEKLRSLGIKEGDIMIVHSSIVPLKATGLTASNMCVKFIEFLGKTGTLAMPAIPLYRDEPTGPERLKDSICAKKLTYDVQRTPPWTGALPKALMGLKGAIRSRHPLNSMVAVGPMAASMMASNLEGERPLPCGLGSSWKFCADHDAKIVCLGVDSAHSLTMIHVAEDCWSSQWPIPNWYRDRLFHVKDGDFETDITVRERRPHWAINYAERTLQKDLIKHDILKIAFVDELRIEVCSSASLINFLNKKKSQGYPYFFPFWTKK